ncbi:hypothetical protein [Kribbella deserti]|uniref:Uncharacterized protein n=1 Tax=Kribbella deserti TaxID=1926257 RepID=A0ABV6QT35_9ACTN
MQTFVLDRNGWSHAQNVEACREILSALRHHAGRFECDIPGDPDTPVDEAAPTSSDEWPDDVRAAARVLRSLPKARIEPGGYAQTGVQTVDSEEVWAAFVTFAPWAFDAAVWGEDWGTIAHLTDEGSMSVELDTADQATIAAIVGASRLVPLREWHQRNKRPRRRPWWRRGE